MTEEEPAELARLELEIEHAAEVWSPYDCLDVYLSAGDPRKAKLQPKIEAARDADVDTRRAVEDFREAQGCHRRPG